MTNKVDKKIKHHYVTRHYLKSWQEKDNVIYVFDKKNNKRFKRKSLNGTGQVKSLYRTELTNESYELLKLTFSKYPACIDILKTLEISAFFNHSNPEELACDFDISLERVEKASDIINQNSLEEMYTSVEGPLHRAIDAVKKDVIEYVKGVGDKKNNMHSLVFLFFLQIHRTEGMIEKMEKEVRNIFLESRQGLCWKLPEEQRKYYLIVHLFLQSLVETTRFLDSSFFLQLMENKTNKLFITSDNPAIIIPSLPINEGRIAHGYMPLTPKIGMIIGRKTNGANSSTDTIMASNASKKDVEKFNNFIKEFSYRYIYSSEEFGDPSSAG